jgi:predicted transcriptional regulator
MTRKEVAIYLGVSEHTVRNMIKSKAIKLDLLNNIIFEDLEKLKLDMEERKNIIKPVWVSRNLY